MTLASLEDRGPANSDCNFDLSFDRRIDTKKVRREVAPLTAGISPGTGANYDNLLTALLLDAGLWRAL